MNVPEPQNLPALPKLTPGISTTLKLFLIGFLVLLLMIPLGLIRGLLFERMQSRSQAQESVAEGWGGQQVLSPAFLSAQSSVNISEEVDGKTRVRRVSQMYSLMPDKVNARAKIAVQTRSVGSTYVIPVYVADVQISGEFSPEDLAQFSAINGLDSNSAQFEFLVQDVRGLSGFSEFQLGELDLAPASLGNAFQRGTALGASLNNSLAPERAKALIEQAIATNKPLTFRLQFSLRGVQSIRMLPMARSLNWRIDGNWPDPSFIGGLSPNTSTIDSTQFAAEWGVSEFNRDFPQIGYRDASSNSLGNATAGVSLAQPGDVYQRNDRAGKYGFMFLALSIAGFFLVEVLLKVRLHPMHYLQIGLALGLFFLLLLALSERLGFELAFLCSSLAITLLIGGYTSAIMASAKRGLVAALVIGATYGFLYVLMASENYSLMLGAIGMLFLLSLIMYLTRNINWYGGAPALPNRPE